MGSTHQAELDTFQYAHGNIGFKPVACLQCSQRKTKCDRASPCTACIRASLSCSAPGPRAPRRARRRNHHEIHDRLARLESLLLDLQKIPTQHEDETDTDRIKYTMREGYIPEFGTSKLWRIAHENLNDVKKQIDEEINELGPWPDIDLLWDPNGTQENICLLNELIPKMPDIFNPLDPKRIRLFGEIFLQRVQPIMSLLHIPKFTELVTWAALCFLDMPPMTRALMWSCFSMAIKSVEKGDCKAWFSLDKDEAVDFFCNQCKIALVEADYLVNFDLDTVRCLILLTMSSQNPHNESENWIFNGVLMRMAYKLGLHRDGTEFNLSPFETEMRRRAWWQLISLEVNRSTVSGFVEPDLPPNWTTRIPHNVNDRELFPSMTGEIVSIDGPADTTYSVMSHEATKILLDCCGFLHIEEVVVGHSASHGNQRTLPISAAACELFVTKLNMRLGLMEKLYCDVSAGPVYEAAVRIRRSFTKIFGSFPNAVTIASEPRKSFEETYLDVAEYVQDAIESMHPWFRWTAWLGFRLRDVYHCIGALERCSDDEILQRTWYLLARLYKNYESLWNFEDEAVRTVAYIVLRAWDKRALQLTSCLQQKEPMAPAFVQDLQQMLLGADLSSMVLEDVLK